MMLSNQMLILNTICSKCMVCWEAVFCGMFDLNTILGAYIVQFVNLNGSPNRALNLNFNRIIKLHWILSLFGQNVLSTLQKS